MARVGDVGADGLMQGASLLSRPADEFGNDETVEAMWAMKAFKHAEIYFNLLSSVDPKLLRLTPQDDAIYKAFRSKFPDLKVDVINETEIKSPEGKEMWRPFCEQFKDEVEDYSFGTLVRLDSSDEFSQENTTLVPRIQFYAIEIARNREGCNDLIREKFRNKKD
ncbi:hypothetical protein ONE63_003228 [Megalurothrips usitatus]|uniref:Polysaccharide biosynthesis domain-containing protein n=1 Tax=Megalurothrips usitatus TaxID=439358 RepID=A0AAV7XAV5_9NEOP|nr:hypothetical protein ONE63_003228 [Megalurothrips usitatus]